MSILDSKSASCDIFLREEVLGASMMSPMALSTEDCHSTLFGCLVGEVLPVGALLPLVREVLWVVPFSMLAALLSTSSTLREHSLIPESLRSLTILPVRPAGGQPFLVSPLRRGKAEDEEEGEYGCDSGSGDRQVGEEERELRRLVRLAMRPSARIALPVF